MLKLTKIFVATFLVAATAGVSQAALTGTWVLDQSNLTASDGGAAIQVDTYKFDVTSTETSPVTSIELAFGGNFWTIAGINATFRNTAELPVFLGQSLADSFFVTDGTQLVGNSEDTTSVLSGAWTLPGATTAIVAPGATTTMAYLTVPTGETPTYTAGRGAVEGSFVDILLGSTGGGDPVAIGDPSDGSMISMQGAFNDKSGVLAEAIMLSNDNPQSDDPLAISELVFTSNDHDLFSAAPNGSDPLKVDLFIDYDAARLLPKQNVQGVLEVRTNGGTLTYTLGARVPEPSTIALSSLALVGLVGLARRRK
ncbi:PEP-CTERM sorting domain-containing protein [Aeoliella sp.]|uniref:PEP-CTERM sorting domain-containing protein n=1 Tax=Aeoliella sp. TaxID=2795800 RepID=UPI003CCBFBF6